MAERRPGEWPVPRLQLDVVDKAEPETSRDRGTAAAARFEMVLGSIKADLTEQPSPMCVRAAKRRWIDAITAAAEDAEQQLRREAG